MREITLLLPTVNPFPLNPEDLLDVGGEIIPDFEKLVDSCNHIMEEFDPGYSQHFCGVHKAIIPIARMRELVDEDDTADTITLLLKGVLNAVNVLCARDLLGELPYHYRNQLSSLSSSPVLS